MRRDHQRMRMRAQVTRGTRGTRVGRSLNLVRIPANGRGCRG